MFLQHNIHQLLPVGHANHRPAFTLIETLAVIVILGLMSGIAISSLSAASTEGNLHRLTLRWSTFEQRARTQAIRNGCNVMLQVQDDSQRVVTEQQKSEASGDLKFIFDIRDIDGFHTIQFITFVGLPTDHICIDPDGRSQDYRIIMSSNGSLRNRVILSISGVTGHITHIIESAGR